MHGLGDTSLEDLALKKADTRARSSHTYIQTPNPKSHHLQIPLLLYWSHYILDPIVYQYGTDWLSIWVYQSAST